MGGECSTHGSDDKCMQKLIRKHEGKRSLRRTRRRWEDNIRMDIRGKMWSGVDICD